MGKVIALLQEKGGSGKTTTAVNLLGVLLEKGFSTILVDMDKDKPDAMFWADNGHDLVDHVIPLGDANPKEKVEELKKKTDFLILDTPGNVEAAALKASLLCDLGVIPCAASLIERKSLEKAAQCIIMAEKPYMFLASRITKNTNATKALVSQIEETGTCFKTHITNSVAMTECQSKGTWVGSYAPNSQNHFQYHCLAEEILAILGVSHE